MISSPVTDRCRRWVIVVALLAGGVCGCEKPGVRPSVSPIEGVSSVTLEEAPKSGVELLYDYDRNALLDSQRVGDVLIALTRAGHLLRFSLPDLAFDRERISVQPFTSLGSDGDHVVAGRADGAVFRVGASGLDLTPVAKFPGRVTPSETKTEDCC